MRTKNRTKLLVCIITFLCFVFNLVGCKPRTNVFTDQGEVGKYYYYTENGTYSMELNENKFTFNNLVETLNGSYTFDGKNLALTFTGEDKSIAVDYKSDSMSFSYKGSTYTFYRDVKWNVSFVADSTNTVTVVNGQKCERPEDPVKENYLFINWYKDSSCKTLFDFEKEVITSDTTVFAKFVKSENKSYEYTVSFETGVSGLNFESVTTFNNTLYTLPTVNEDGKTFVGWWASHYENGSKLTYQFLPAMPVNQDMVLYAVYENNAPLVSVEDGKIVWDSKGVNKYYSVNIRNADDTLEDPYFSQNVQTTSVEFDFDTLPAGNYLVEVTTGNYTGKAYYANKKLSQVCKFEVSDFKLKWNSVDNATNYLITVECGLTGHKHNNLALGNVTEYDFSDCTMPSSGIKFVVTAKADGYMASTSKEYVYYLGLSKATNVMVDQANQTLTWDKVDGAASYKVTVLAPNGQTYTYTTMTNTLAIDSFYGELKFTVTPVAKGYYSETTEYSYNKTSLTTPTNIKIVGYDVVWDAVEGAVSYNVVIGEKTFTSNKNSYTLTLEEIEAIKDFKISVQAVASNSSNNSLYSPEVVINKDGVNSIEFKNGVISWNSVPFVSKYAVKVDDSEVVYVENNTQVDYKITSGKHTIYVAIVDAEGKVGNFFQANIEVYALILNTCGGDELESLYFVKGDTIKELPTPTYEGYNFIGWYDVENGAVNGGSLFDAKMFDSDTDIEVYASWNGKNYLATLDYATYGSGDITEVVTTFGSSFTLPVPKVENNLKAFIGWYSELNGQGEKYTTPEGKSIRNWRDYSDVKLYAGWVDVFTFNLINDGKAYSVSKGPGIDYLSTITIPTSFLGLPVTTVESGAFASCYDLVTVNIPSSIVNIEIGSQGPNGSGSCFQYCYKLEAVNIYPVEGVAEEDIHYYSIDGVVIYRNDYNGYELKYFPGNTKGGTYTIPSIVTTLPIYAFRSCTKLTELVIPATVTKIDESAFSGCNKLVTITFLEPEEGEQVNELLLGDKAFQSNSSLEVINLPARVQEFNINIFTYCSLLKEVNIVGSYEKAVYSSIDGVLVTADKSEIIFCPRTKEGSYVTPVGVEKIGPNAFEACNNLTEVTISGQINYIGENAFKSCKNIENLYFLGHALDKPLTIMNSAFYGCIGLTELTLPLNLVTIEQNAFGGTTKLTRVEVYSISPNIDFKYAAFGTTTTTVNSVPTYYVKDLFIAKEVAAFDITGVFGSKVLSTVEVEKGNPNYASIDGVLYNSDVTKVVYYPSEREGSYELPESVVEIGDRVFEAKTLDSIKIGQNVTFIGTGAFQNCTNLVEVIFEDGGTEDLIIGANAFEGCTSLKSLQLPSRLTQILKEAFRKCSSIPELVIPEGVKTIGEAAFRNCSGLVRVVLPSSIEDIKESADTSTLIDDKTPRIHAFDYCTNLTEFVLEGENENYKVVDGILYRYLRNDENEVTGFELVVCPQSKAGVVDLPAEVTKISNYAFYQNKLIVELAFSKGLNKELTIGTYAFNGCNNLAKVDLPTGLTDIAAYAFWDCKQLSEVVIPNTLKTLTTKVFYSCPLLSNVTFAEGGTEPLVIGDGTVTSNSTGPSTYSGPFTNCPGITTLIFPERLTSIGKYAFAGMTNLQNVYIPSSVTEIKDYAFYNCSGLTNLTFAQTCNGLVLGSSSFSSSGVTSLKLPEGLTTISSNAFSSCKSITSVSIPASVVKIDNYAFFSNSSLTTLQIATGSKLEVIGNDTFAKTDITSVSLPQSIKTIGNYAFEDCKNLTSVTFEGSDTEEGSSLETIGSYAFSGCISLTSFAFPYCGKDASGVYRKIKLGGSGTNVHIFQNAKSLTKVYLSEAVASINNLFVKCPALETIEIADNSENFKVSPTQPIILNVNGTAIQFLFGRVSGEFIIPEGVTEIGTYAFSGQVDITKVVIPKSMKTINNYAFSYCYGLTEVEFAKGCVVDIIGQGAFEGCRNLQSFVIPDNVTVISNSLFAGCESLTSVTIPEGVTKIDQKAFIWTTSLKQIKLPSTLKEIMNYAFVYSGIESIVIPEGVQSLYAYAFEYCNSLTYVKLPSTITLFQGSVFRECKVLKTVEMSNDLTILGASTFYKCPALEEVQLSSSLKLLPDSIFLGCTALKSIELPESLTHMAASASLTASSSAFDGCTALESVTFLGNNLVYIGTYAFRNCTSLKELELPSSVTTIGNYAFSNVGFTSVSIPTNITKLGNNVYSGCTSLESVNILGQVTFGTNIFEKCTALTTAVIADKNTSISNYFFDGCTSLINVTLPAELTTLGTYAFRNCSSLKKITLPSKLTKIGSTSYSASANTFENCTSLEEVEILGKATYIGSYVFKNCTSLKTINIPTTCVQIGNYAFQYTAIESIDLSKLTALGTYAFHGCKSLKSVVLPNIAILPNYAFKDCTSLTSVEILNKTTKIGSSSTAGNTFEGCTSLENVKINGNITLIGCGAFKDCTSLKTIDIPSTVTEIGNFAFYGSGITSANIPAKTTKIGTAAFNGCQNLKNLTIDGGNTAYIAYDNTAIVALANMTVVSVYNASGDYTLPDNVLLGSYALQGATLNTLTLPDSLTTLPTYALFGLTADKVVFGTGITSLSSYALKNSVVNTVVFNAEEVTLGTYSFEASTISNIENSENIVAISNKTFLNCKNLTSISLSEKLLKIDANAFEGSGLTSIDIPSSVVCLGTFSATSTASGSVFLNCENLTSVTLHEGLEKINDSAFVGTALTSITLPSTVTAVGTKLCQKVDTLENVTILGPVLGTYAFDGCTNLTTVNMSEKLEKIPTYAFSNCPVLTSVTFAESTYEIGTHAFENCPSLTQVTLPNALTTIQTSAFQNSGLTSVVMPANVKNIFQFAFQDCVNLVSVGLNEGLESLGASAGTNPAGSVFKNCVNLESIVLPKSLQYIGSYTFQNCNKIKSVTVYDNCLAVGNAAFAGWTSEQKVNIVAALYDVVGSWCDTISTASNTVFWGESDAVFTFEYKVANK